jgi:hypothetical protein
VPSSPLAPARRLALIVISVGLLIAGAGAGVVLVLAFDTLLGFVAVAAGMLGARSGERRWAYIAFLERCGGRYATPAMLGAASWIPSFRGGSEGPSLGGTGDSLGGGGDGGRSE